MKKVFGILIGAIIALGALYFAVNFMEEQDRKKIFSAFDNTKIYDKSAQVIAKTSPQTIDTYKSYEKFNVITLEKLDTLINNGAERAVVYYFDPKNKENIAFNKYIEKTKDKVKDFYSFNYTVYPEVQNSQKYWNSSIVPYKGDTVLPKGPSIAIYQNGKYMYGMYGVKEDRYDAMFKQLELYK